MLIPESKWFAARMKMLPNEALFPMLNLGSQTGAFRRAEQPWLERYVLEPLIRRGGRIVHSDLQTGEGIDLSGDLSDPEFRSRLREMRFQSIICSNLLEHVVNRDEFVRYITPILPVGGLLFISVPNQFPYHPDPIDTYYRPDPQDMSRELFPELRCVRAEVVDGPTYAPELLRRPWLLVRDVRKWPGLKDSPSGTAGSRLRWLFRPYRVSCAVLRRE